jgi:hypothetical protein
MRTIGNGTRFLKRKAPEPDATVKGAVIDRANVAEATLVASPSSNTLPVTGILRERYGDPYPQQRIIIQGNHRDTPGTVLQGAWESGSSLFKKFQRNTMKNVCFKGGEVALEYLQSKSREEIPPPHDGDFTESYVDALASEGLIHTETADGFKKMYPGIPGKPDDRLVMFPRIRRAPHDIRPTDFLREWTAA